MKKKPNPTLIVISVILLVSRLHENGSVPMVQQQSWHKSMMHL